MSNALYRGIKTFLIIIRAAPSQRYVFCLSHGPYRIGLAYQLRYHYRLELFSVVTTAAGSVVSTVFVRPLCSLSYICIYTYIRILLYYYSILLIKVIKSTFQSFRILRFRQLSHVCSRRKRKLLSVQIIIRFFHFNDKFLAEIKI